MDAGVDTVNRTDQALRNIILGAERSLVMSSLIARATREQAAGSQAVARASREVVDLSAEIARATVEQARGPRVSS